MKTLCLQRTSKRQRDASAARAARRACGRAHAADHLDTCLYTCLHMSMLMSNLVRKKSPPSKEVSLRRPQSKMISKFGQTLFTGRILATTFFFATALRAREENVLHEELLPENHCGQDLRPRNLANKSAVLDRKTRVVGTPLISRFQRRGT